MASRLDRLVLLLDTGSASGIRSTAAQQLGDIMRQHPNELRNLLNRVSVHLCSQNWETRIAAGQAIGSIAKNTTYWNSDIKIEDPKLPNLEKKSALCFKELDIGAVMKNGKHLLGSAGKEYDVEINNMSVAERLNFFRKDLKKRLGLEQELLDDLIDDEDVFIKQEPISLKVESPTNEIDMSALSARERNKLKRKNKRDLKDKANEARKRVDTVKTKTVDSQIISNDSRDDKVVIESKVLMTETFDPRDWPFEDFCESLCLDLFDPNWTVRHGAAIGLREILKHHGDNAGKIAGLSSDFNTKFHNEWLEDVCVRLLCVLVLDRFCDFVSDQAVAPVRETCSQTLGTLIQYAPEAIVMKTQECLLHFIFDTGKDAGGQVRWESRHAGLLGLKYLVAVRTDLIHRLLEGTVGAVLAGLQDNDDDVVAISASALLPITQSLVDLLPDRVVEIISLLWRCMSNVKDDLSASTGSIMDLIAKLFSYPHVLQAFKDLAVTYPQYSLHNLVPILFPFFRHTISSVRMAVLTTLKLFTEADHKGGWIDARILRLVFQNLIVEEKPTILHESEALWHLIMAKLALDPSQYYEVIRSCVPSWLSILMTPLGSIINEHFFFLPKSATSGDQSGLEMAHNIDIAILTSDFSLIHPDVFVRNRLISAKAFGHLMQVLPLDEIALLFEGSLKMYVQSSWGIHQQLSAVIVEAWFTGNEAIHNQMQLKQDIMTMLLRQIEANVNTTFHETVPHLKRLKGECLALINTAIQEGGLNPNTLPTFPVTVLGESDDGFNLTMAQSLAQLTIDSIVPIVGASCQRNLSERRNRILTSIDAVQNFIITIETQVSSAISCGLIALEILPPKLNPIIRSVMNSIKSESTLELQTRSAHGLAKLVFLCSQPNATTNPTAKIVKNLSAFLCSDVESTPIFSENQTKLGIYTLRLFPFNQDKSKTKVDIESLDGGPKLIRRGAELCFEQFCKVLGPELFTRIPKLWDIVYVQQQQLLSRSVEEFNLAVQTEPKLGQELIDSLQVISKLIPFVEPTLLPSLHPILPWVIKALLSQFSIIRFVAARCLSALSDRMLSACMNEFITNGLPFFTDITSITNRQGVVEAVYYILTTLNTKILPYVIFMVVPVLGRMSDNDDAVRLLASNCFALLINLIPLESGIPDPPDIAPELIAQRITERKFLSQLLDNSQVENYKLPIKVNAELRSYQQEGVNWLAFLNKYQLHGILCDDMGLGKTLQSICILASDHHFRKTRYEETKLPDAAHLPSLVICPPTLIGHWFHEIQNYVGTLQPFIYSGSSIERRKIFNNLTIFDVVITSYDIVRNDIEALEPIQFNYCILDEGHIIKNTKTKLTKAIKTLKANHRLILSGTPIQNNVLELWSLFDFLMPGFLGTEKSFNERYSRPILASREAKSSSKEQELGALALEALHKQVLPFLLRRLKEDVLDDLPPKIIQDYYCDLGEVQKQLYEDFAKSKHSPGAELDSNGDAKTNSKTSHVFQSLQYMRKLCNHPLLVLTEKHPKYQQFASRPGGLDSLKELVHAPKLLALKQLLNDCGIGNRADTTEDSLITSAVSQHRVLIFCQLKSMLDLVEHQLLKQNLPTVSYLRLDGSIDHMQRHDMVQQFNSDPSIDVLLLTTHIGGLGLNLTGADTVIFVEHDWNPMKDLQAMDRAHRIGQKKVVNVYRLISRGTLEEKIMGLQKFKLNIANSVVNQQNSGLSSMDTNQLLDLFKPPSTSIASAASTEQDPTGQTNSLGNNFKQALEGIEKLWDEKQYDEEFDLNQFIDGLKNE